MARKKKIMEMEEESKFVLGKKTEIEKVYASVDEHHTLTLVDGVVVDKKWTSVYYYAKFNNNLEFCVVPRGIGESGKYEFGISVEVDDYYFEIPAKRMEYPKMECDWHSDYSWCDYPPITIPEEVTGKLIANVEGILVSAYNADEDLDPAKFLASMNMVAQCVRTILNGEA